jgi:hypothetical protein
MMGSRDFCHRSRRQLYPGALLTLLCCFPGALAAQPFGIPTAFVGNGTLGSTNGALTVPASAALNPSHITVEAWISVESPAGQSCRSVIGKGYQSTWWMGVCGNQLRTYTSGVSSSYTQGTVPFGPWTHIAMTSDGTTRKHYVNGELVGTVAESTALTTNSKALQIGSDPDWAYSPNGEIDEVRLWNVVRTAAEIQANLNVPIRTAQPGLVAVWPMGGPDDVINGHDGSFSGDLPPVLPPAVESTCGSSSSSAFCLGGKFAVSANWRVGDNGSSDAGPATTVPSTNSGSGVFWFFGATDWEILVKVLNGCAINNKWWVFSAATTNLYYEIEVTDVQSGQTKLYFNYPGPPAPALTDTAAFDCP